MVFGCLFCLKIKAMKRLVLFGLVLGLITSCGQVKKDLVEGYEDGIADASAEASSIPVLTVDAFNVDAGQYIDKKVAIAGIVDHVCKHSGKKLKLVTNGGSVHVESETRFEDALVGNQIQLTGIVREQRIDESTCLQMEEDNIKKHREGTTNQEQFDHKVTQIKHYRDSMAVAGVDHLSFYTLEFVALDKDTE
jgi:hypothetical protein